ncbi:MAG: Crp/Fnr family transcriptional regulator [Anaerolineae bacterium]|nr:Crp/Fnr family transcriptional regulator [Anaerolineae bacterium]
MVEMLTVQNHIRSIIYFEGIAEAELSHITDHSLLRAFSAGEMIFLEGEPADGLWIVESGHIKIFKLNPDGGEHILHLRGPGKSFNDIAALDGGSNPANATVLSPEAQVWLVPSEVITAVLMRDAQVALNVIRLLAVRVRSLVGQIEDLALYSVVVRLARFLLKQAEDPSLSGPGVTRMAIAAHINTTPQTISNVLRSLEDAGAIQFDRHRIMIVNESILRSIALW